jgi:lysylphosphatidylglycerol synthetase-like protein (DUF2156 family)
MPDIPAASLLGLDVPNLLPESVFGVNLDWMRPAGRLIWSTVMLVIGVAVVGYLATRPKRAAEPATWAATIAGAMFVWVLLILAYGTVPHEWLNFSSAYLDFGKNTFALRQSSVVPFDVTREAVAHIVVSGIYVALLGLNVALFVRWQQRKVAEPVDGEDTTAARAPWFRRRLQRTSAYGRPVTVTE